MSLSVSVFKLINAELAWALVKTGLVVLSVLVLIVGLLWVIGRFGLARAVANRVARSDVPGVLRSNPTTTQFLATVPVTLLSVLVVPAALFVIAFVIMYLFMVLCWPFLALGKADAAELCSAKRAAVGVVELANAPSPLVLLECSETFCALIRPDGDLLVVQSDAVERVRIVPVRAALPSERPLPRCRIHKRQG